VTSKDDLAAVAEKVQSEVGFVNTVVANSGITGPTTQSLKEGASIAEIQEFLWKEPMEAYTKTFELNCTAVLYTLLAFLPLLDAGNKNEASPYHVNGVKSQFITTASIASFNRKSTAGFGYGASKAGVAHLMKMMANFLAPHSIRVNVFCPGLFPSEMSAVSAPCYLR
jgi:NAD(P)-dependent dehydrogenase (short-subunit alcohol dehydrogenase family)